MIVIICGGRHFTDRDFLFAEMDALHALRPISLVIEGGQRTWSKLLGRNVGGADLFAAEWAAARKVPRKRVPADWSDLSHPDAVIRTNRRGEQYDAKAGGRRNQTMLEMGPALVAAFSPSGNGTADMVRRARAANVEVIERRAP